MLGPVTAIAGTGAALVAAVVVAVASSTTPTGASGTRPPLNVPRAGITNTGGSNSGTYWTPDRMAGAVSDPIGPGLAVPSLSAVPPLPDGPPTLVAPPASPAP